MALPVFRSRDLGKPQLLLREPDAMEFATDYEIFDGDPLVVFIAFSVSVTWNLFLFPLTLGLTIAWGGSRPGILAVEMAVFLIIFIFSFDMRNKRIKELQPYLTREEVAWPYGGIVILGFYAIATIIVLIAALASLLQQDLSIELWHRWGISDSHAILFVTKFLCVVSLLLGTYTTNKDMFIFFKTIAAEKMRNHWLHTFFADEYPVLQARVGTAISNLPEEAKNFDRLYQLWNDGFPGMIWTHPVLKQASPAQVQKQWKALVSKKGGALSWIVDVPRVATWAAQIKDALAEYK